jgi:hypothetical protein
MVRKHLPLIAASFGVMLVAGGAAGSHAGPALGSGDGQRTAAAESSSTTWHVDAELIHVLEKEASRKVSAYLQDRGRLSVVDVSVSINMVDRMILADFGPGFLPGPDEAEMFLHELAVTLRHYAEQAGLPIIGVDFHYQGKPLRHYHPTELAVPPRARIDARNQAVLVSSSHGLIRVHPALNWDYQRPDAFGFREDMITPAYGDALQLLLEERSGSTVTRARNRSQDLHSESNRPWEYLSSRYHLKALMPDRTDIWNSLPNDTDNDREVKEDIRTRPLYANHLGVGTLVSLHTNGHELGAVRGVEVYYHGDKPDDRPLAENVLCGMRELIRAQPGYESFPARQAASPGRHGENRIGTMPSVLVEIAYHSNAEDSAALQDPVFRAASMKGVEKGVRLFRQGKTCEPFVLQPIPDVSLATGTSQEITLPFAGHPQFPVTMEFTTANCSSPGACTPSRTTFDDPNAPITAMMICRGSLAGTARWSVVLRDVDGVATAPVEFQQTCSRPGASPAA